MGEKVNGIISIPRCSLSQVGAVFSESLQFNEWAAIGKQIIRASECVQWLIGDWINFGWKQYVERSGGQKPLMNVKYRVALESLPHQYETLRNYSWIARSVELSRRRDKLSFKHHAEVAGLDAKDQAKFLTIAEKEGLSCADLRALIRGQSQESKSEQESTDCHLRDVILLAGKLAKEREQFASWPPRRRELWKEKLRPLAELLNACVSEL